MRLFDTRLIILPCAAMLLNTGIGTFAYGNEANKHVSSSDVQKHAFDRSTVLMFTSGSSELSSVEMGKIRDLVTTIGLENVDRVEIAAWSDKAFPRDGKDLPKTDADLADNRISSVKDYLKDSLNVTSVKTFNMAETSNWLARSFRTDAAELKSIFAKDASAPMAREDFNLISREGTPSRAVVVVVQKM